MLNLFKPGPSAGPTEEQKSALKKLLAKEPPKGKAAAKPKIQPRAMKTKTKAIILKTSQKGKVDVKTAAAISGFVGEKINPGTEASVIEQLKEVDVPRHKIIGIARKIGKEAPAPVNMDTFAPFLVRNLR